MVLDFKALEELGKQLKFYSDVKSQPIPVDKQGTIKIDKNILVESIKLLSTNHKIIGLADSDHSAAGPYELLNAGSTAQSLSKAGIKHLFTEFQEILQPIVDKIYAERGSNAKTIESLRSEMRKTGSSEKNVQKYTNLVQNYSKAGIHVHGTDSNSYQQWSDQNRLVYQAMVTLSNADDRARYESEKLDAIVTRMLLDKMHDKIKIHESSKAGHGNSPLGEWELKVANLAKTTLGAEKYASYVKSGVQVLSENDIKPLAGKISTFLGSFNQELLRKRYAEDIGKATKIIKLSHGENSISVEGSAHFTRHNEMPGTGVNNPPLDIDDTIEKAKKVKVPIIAVIGSDTGRNRMELARRAPYDGPDIIINLQDKGYVPKEKMAELIKLGLIEVQDGAISGQKKNIQR